MKSSSLSKYVASNPRKIFIGFMIATIAMLYFAINGLSIRVVLEEMLPASSENVKLIQKYGAQFGGANTTLISLRNRNGNIYSEDYLKKYAETSEKIYFYAGAKRHLIQSLALRKTKSIAGAAGRIEINALMWPNVPQGPEEMEEFKHNVRNQYRGLLVSDDETASLIVADFDDNIDYEGLLNELIKIKSELDLNDIEMSFSGRPVLMGYIYQNLDETVLILGLSLLLISGILWLYFNSFVGVLAPLAVACSATVWGLGFMGVKKYNLDPLLILLPAFIFAIVLSHCVQFITRVFDYYDKGLERRECVETSLRKILFPSVGAITTDAAGFTVLVLVGIPSIQALATICTVWLLAIFPAIIFCASLVSFFDKPKKLRTGIKSLSAFWKRINLEDNYRGVVFVGLVFLVMGIYGAGSLTIGDKTGSPIFWEDHDFNKNTQNINSLFSGVGTDLMQVFINGDEKTMLDPKTYETIEGLNRYIYENVESSTSSQSLVPIIKNVNKVLYEGDPSYEFVPDNEQAVAFNIYLFRSKGEPGDFAAYTNKDWEIGSVSYPLKDHSSRTVEDAIGAVSSYFDSLPAGSYSNNFEFTGGQIGLAESINREIKNSNYKVMSIITLVIIVCVSILYRSASISIIVVLSLAVSNFLTYAFMAYKGIGLSINTLPLAALGIGMGVDFSIYVLDRIKEEVHEGLSPYGAISKAIATSGNAVFLTAITMIIPLTPWFFLSEMKFQAEMGLLLGLVLFLNMVGALIFVPALLLEFKPRRFFEKKEDCLNSENFVKGMSK